MTRAPRRWARPGRADPSQSVSGRALSGRALSGRAPCAWALAMVGSVALLVAGCTAGPATTGGSPDDAGPELDPSVTLPLKVDGVASCRIVRQQPMSSPGAAPVVSDAGPRLIDLNLPCLTSGPDVNPARLSGRPVVVNLWATWCLPCRKEMPMLQQTQAREQGKVQFLGVDTKDRPDWAAEFLPLVQVTYPQVVDTDGRLLAAVRSPGLPVTIVLDREGRVIGQQVGGISQQRLDELIGQAGS